MNSLDRERKAACNLLCNNSMMFFFCDSDAVSRWIGSCKNVLKFPYSVCLLSRKVAIQTVRNFAPSDTVTYRRLQVKRVTGAHHAIYTEATDH